MWSCPARPTLLGWWGNGVLRQEAPETSLGEHVRFVNDHTHLLKDRQRGIANSVQH